MIGVAGSSGSNSMSMPKRGSPGNSWMMKNQPQSSLSALRIVGALRLRDGQIEAEEADVGIDLGA